MQLNSMDLALAFSTEEGVAGFHSVRSMANLLGSVDKKGQKSLMLYNKDLYTVYIHTYVNVCVHDVQKVLCSEKTYIEKGSWIETVSGDKKMTKIVNVTEKFATLIVKT